MERSFFPPEHQIYLEHLSELVPVPVSSPHQLYLIQSWAFLGFLPSLEGALCSNDYIESWGS